MNFSGYAGQKTGVPYPVLARISFGTFGANLPALIRALVAIAWYGIQTWLASRTVIIIALKIWQELLRPGRDRWEDRQHLGASAWRCHLRYGNAGDQCGGKFVSPAYDLANVWPARIDFRRGGLVAAMIALVITPWNLFTVRLQLTYSSEGSERFSGR